MLLLSLEVVIGSSRISAIDTFPYQSANQYLHPDNRDRNGSQSRVISNKGYHRIEIQWSKTNMIRCMEEYKITPLPDSGHLEKASDCLRTIAHPVRLRMVQLLMRGRYSVGELANSCKVQNHMASEHLRLMQRAGLLRSRREGRKIYYSIRQKSLFGLMERVESLYGEEAT